jgi:hypothetical protein
MSLEKYFPFKKSKYVDSFTPYSDKRSFTKGFLKQSDMVGKTSSSV